MTADYNTFTIVTHLWCMKIREQVRNLDLPADLVVLIMAGQKELNQYEDMRVVTNKHDDKTMTKRSIVLFF